MIQVKGDIVDDTSKCKHYHSEKDIIAIKMKCCNTYYACIHCHSETAGHETIVWEKNEFKTKAVMCGNCKNELTIIDYLNCENICPTCKASFNPGCENHYHYYFSMD